MITYCIYCIHKTSIKNKKPNYVIPSIQYIDYCSATKKKVLCINRNKKGKCKHYDYVGRSFPI